MLMPTAVPQTGRILIIDDSADHNLLLQTTLRNARAVGTYGLAVYAMPQAAQDTGDGVLRLSGLPSFFLDLRRLPKTGDLSSWMAAPHSFYAVGARWNQASPESNNSVYAMSSTFDGLIFIQNGHAVSGLQ
jgi:hypothetical protein